MANTLENDSSSVSHAVKLAAELDSKFADGYVNSHPLAPENPPLPFSASHHQSNPC